MANTLVIVESPAKAKTIEKFLGPGHKVMASYGHVRDLPSKDGSVDVDHGFAPKYVVSAKARKQLGALRQALQEADRLILATDPDREGEAISWHLLEALGVDERGKAPKVSRVVFHEITRDAVAEAMAHPRQISRELVEAQQARRILDYLVGFTLSPVLWRKIKGSRSAGRVQSVALRLICEREAEIEAFVPREYWTIEAALGAGGGAFSARLHAIDGNRLDKFAIGTAAEADQLVAAIRPLPFTVGEIARTEKQRRPSPPFTTSTLQQEANRKLGFPARKTMSLAQRLYEGIDIGDGPVGLITYMRTDSVNLSTVAQHEAREVIEARYGRTYLPAKARTYQNKAKNAQEAHEAIRPTSLARHPEAVKGALGSDEYRLYRLIWERTLASQMANAVLDATTVDIQAGDRYQFRASGQVVRFPGFMKVYIEGRDQDPEEVEEGVLPELAQGERLALNELHGEGHVTQPPPRYTEASLVKTLEEHGIGRPSTYAAIMNTLVERKYARLVKRTFYPEDLGREVTRFLTREFERYVDYGFTAGMEEDLDAISRGEQQWQAFLKGFWEPFREEVKTARGKSLSGEELGEDCPECAKPLVKKFGKKGYFIACTGYPECRYTRPLNGEKAEEPVLSEEKCAKCAAPMLIKDGRYGKYLACSAYPACKNIQPLNKPKGTGVACPECREGELTEKKSRYGKVFYSCNRYPKCKYAVWDPPLAEPCPQCAHPVTVNKTTKRDGTFRRCPQEGCGWSTLPAAEKPAGTTKAAPAKKRRAPAKAKT